MRGKLPVASAQRRPILCFEFSHFVEPSGIGCTILTCVQRIFCVAKIIPKFVTSRARWTQLRTIVKSCSQSQTVPQNLRTQNIELVGVVHTLQGAFFSFSLLRTDCRVCTQVRNSLRYHSHGRKTWKYLFFQSKLTCQDDHLGKGWVNWVGQLSSIQLQEHFWRLDECHGLHCK